MCLSIALRSPWRNAQAVGTTAAGKRWCPEASATHRRGGRPGKSAGQPCRSNACTAAPAHSGHRPCGRVQPPRPGSQSSDAVGRRPYASVHLLHRLDKVRRGGCATRLPHQLARSVAVGVASEAGGTTADEADGGAGGAANAEPRGPTNHRASRK